MHAEPIGQPLPTTDDLIADLRSLRIEGFRAALAAPLPAFSALPSVQRAAQLGTSARDKEIERLIRLAIEQLSQRLVSPALAYLLGRGDHATRRRDAAARYGVAESSFRRIQSEQLAPQMVRALLKIAEEDKRQLTDDNQQLLTRCREPAYEEMFEDCPEGQALYEREMTAVEERTASTWWAEGSSRWFGNYFAFWHKTLTVPCDEVRIVSNQGYYGAHHFGFDRTLDGDKDKLTIVSMSRFLTDSPDKTIYCGVTNWEFAFKWAKEHADDLLSSGARPSVFGIAGRPAYPGIAGIHSLLQTADGYLLFGLRNEGMAYHELTWSASFEESVSPEPRRIGPRSGDATVLDTITGGLDEEWGIEPAAVVDSTVLAVGREYLRISPQRLDLSSSILTAVRLSLDLSDVWQCLEGAHNIQDFDEHRAWVGVRFASREDILQLLCFGRGRKHGCDFFREFAERCESADVVFHPGGRSTNIEDRGLMPTSAARLYLGSLWLDQHP